MSTPATPPDAAATSTARPADGTPADDAQGSAWLLLTVDGTGYGLSLAHVREIRRAGEVTPVPAVPDFVDGVMNLRGRIVPVVDLRARFGLPRAAHDRFTVVVVIEVGGRTCGLVADAVQDVATLPSDRIDAPPTAVPGEGGAFVRGLAHHDDTLTILLDAAALMVETDDTPGTPDDRH